MRTFALAATLFSCAPAPSTHLPDASAPDAAAPDAATAPAPSLDAGLADAGTSTCAAADPAALAWREADPVTACGTCPGGQPARVLPLELGEPAQLTLWIPHHLGYEPTDTLGIARGCGSGDACLTSGTYPPGVLTRALAPGRYAAITCSGRTNAVLEPPPPPAVNLDCTTATPLAPMASEPRVLDGAPRYYRIDFGATPPSTLTIRAGSAMHTGALGAELYAECPPVTPVAGGFTPFLLSSGVPLALLSQGTPLARTYWVVVTGVTPGVAYWIERR